MDTFIQAFVISFREGLEAFLVIAILLQFLDKTSNSALKKYVFKWAIVWIVISLIIWLGLANIPSFISDTEISAKIWESVASFVVVILITTFIVWMIKHWNEVKKKIENKASLNLSKKWIFLLTLFMVLREWVEISLFSFAWKYSSMPVIVWILVAVLVVLLLYCSIFNIKLNTMFSITLFYLILQAWFLIWYSIHEGLSAFKEIWLISDNSLIFSKAFDFSNNILNHKEGILWIPLYVTFGWYSKPEWIQFIIQYFYTISFLIYWHIRKPKYNKKSI